MKTSSKMAHVIRALAHQHGLDLTRSGAVLRLVQSGYQPLVIRVVEPNLVSVAHIYQPRADVRMGDPEIVYFTGAGEWIPLEVTQVLGGYRIYGGLTPDGTQIAYVDAPQQADLAALNMAIHRGCWLPG